MVKVCPVFSKTTHRLSFGSFRLIVSTQLTSKICKERKRNFFYDERRQLLSCIAVYFENASLFLPYLMLTDFTILPNYLKDFHPTPIYYFLKIILNFETLAEVDLEVCQTTA